MRDIDATIISQYEHSPRLLALIRAFNRLIDPEPQIAAFYALAVDPDTAKDWGLDCWGRIVAIERKIELTGDDSAFGFIGSGLNPFNQGVFYTDNVTNTYVLSNDAFRLLIYCKAASNITDGSLRDLNAIMARLFDGRGRVMVLHTGAMVIRYVFEFELKPYERALLLRDDVPPKPAGVGYEVLEIPYPAFGFAGSGLHPFNQGTFAQGVRHAYTDQAG